MKHAVLTERQNSPKANSLKKQGRCPWNKEPCERARVCILTKGEGCSRVVEAQVNRCSRSDCKRRFGGCSWSCFIKIRRSK